MTLDNHNYASDVLYEAVVDHRYHILNKLGEGSMGVVFRVLDRLTGKFVALKKVSAEIGQQPEVEQSLRLALAQEFQSLASLRHPNIVTVLDYGFAEDNTPYLIMELLEDAVTVTEAGKAEPLAVQVGLLIQMLQALAYLHQRGIVHRDVKPKNVLVTNGQLRVLDFGIASLRGQSKGVAGTLAYMAPEVLTGQPADIPADLYGVGMIAFELFSGYYPYENSHQRSNEFESDATIKLDYDRLIQSILRTPLNALTAGLDAPIVSILDRLLAKNPTSRYGSALEVIEAMNTLLDQPIPYETASTRESFLQAAPLIGRDQELALFSESLSQVVNGNGKIWLIGGESGVGKSRLVDELRVRALVQGILVLRGQAIKEGAQPYQEWRDVLRWLVLQSPLTDFEASVLKALVPDISTLLGYSVPDAPELDPLAMQERLVSVIESIFKYQKRPLLIALEDLQWSGSEGIALLSRLGRSLSRLPIVIVANYRDDEQANLPNDIPNAQNLKLNRLTQQNIAELSQSMLGMAGQKPAVVSFLQRETEGNVFFLIEVVRALAREAGQLDKIGELTLPELMLTGGVQQFIRLRLSRIPPESRPLLLLAAIAGRDLDLAVLEKLDSLTNLQRWLNICADAGALEALGERWRFAHDKLRETLVNEAPSETRAILHRQVAQAIEQAYPNAPEQAVALTYHWSQAGDAVKASQYALIAGEQALLSGAYREAVQFLRQALTHAGQNLTKLQAATIEYQLGMAYYGLGNLDGSHAHMLEALDLLGWKTPTSPRKIIQALLKEFVLQVVRPVRVLERYSTHPREVLLLVSRIYAHLTQIGFFTGSMLASALYVIRAVNFAEAAGRSPELARSYAHITLALGLAPLHGLAQYYSKRSLAIARAANQTVTLGYSLYINGFYLSTIGNWSQARAAIDEAVQLLEAVGDKRRWREAQANLGFMLGLQGRFAESLMVRANLKTAADRDGDIQARAWGIAGMGEMALWLHHMEDAIRYLEARIGMMDQLKDVMDPTTPSYALLALAYWRNGDIEKAFQAAKEAMTHMALLKTSGFHSFHGLASLTEVYLRMWEALPDGKSLAADTAHALTALRTFARRFPVYHAWALRNLGMYLWLMGKQTQARSAWKKSLNMAIKLNMPYDEALARYEIGRHLLLSNSQRQLYLQRAAEIFANLDATYDQAQVNKELLG